MTEGPAVDIERKASVTFSINVPTIVTLVTLAAGVIWHNANVSNRGDALERRAERMEQSDAKIDAASRIARLEERQVASDQRVAELKDDIKDVSNKADRILAQLNENHK